MSTPNTSEEPPRYGQRSPDWTPEPTEPDREDRSGTGTPWKQYGTRSGEDSGTPWPKYGETSAGSGPTGEPRQSGPQPASGPSGQGRGGPWAPQGWPQPSPGSAAPAPGPLPSRAGAVVLLVLGVVVATIIAFAAFIGVALAGMDFQDVVNSATPVANGDTVEVDTSGSYTVVDTEGGRLSCDLRSSDGTDTALDGVSGYTSMVMGSDIPSGSYTLSCQTTGNASLVGMTGLDASQMTEAVMRGFTWGTVLGFIGIAMVVGAVVWLVRINRRRSEIQRRAWQTGPGRY